MIGMLLTACSPPEGQDARTLDLQLATGQISPFAGFRSEEGVLTIFVFDEAQLEAAKAQVSGIFADPRPALSVRPARGQASEALKNTATDVLSISGTSSLDFDETSGYLRLGVWKANALEPTQKWLLEHSVSLDQVIIQAERLIAPAT